MHPFIEAEKQSGHNVERACELLKVSRTAFYARRTGKPGPRAVRDAELTGQIAAVHQHSRGTYGAPRIHAALQRKGASCGRRRVARLMRAAGLQGRHRDDRAADMPRRAISRARRPGRDGGRGTAHRCLVVLCLAPRQRQLTPGAAVLLRVDDRTDMIEEQ
ncbi:IS3 family transposase [Streptomyces sp. NBC_00873]|uniref:IS3 family transposase n=1 Tax=Streptomyces sp. NBC_00873 TaxID=2975852 RepID=UPI00386EB14D